MLVQCTMDNRPYHILFQEAFLETIPYSTFNPTFVSNQIGEQLVLARVTTVSTNRIASRSYYPLIGWFPLLQECQLHTVELVTVQSHILLSHCCAELLLRVGLIRTHVHATRMHQMFMHAHVSPALNRSLAIQHFKHSDPTEIHDGLIYMRLSHTS